MLPMTVQFLIVMIASAINGRLQRKLDYLEEERRIFKEQLEALTGGKRLSFTARQRRRLAEAGKLLSPDERRRCCRLVKPATILAWFRQLAAKKYDSSKTKRGRPPKPKDVRKLVVEMALATMLSGFARGWAVDREAGWLGRREWNERQGYLPVAPWRNAQFLPS
jgi:hypothetical protein